MIISLAVAIVPLPSVLGQATSDEALQLATSILTKGARTFDTKDAGAMAETYTEDAEIQLTSRENGELKVAYHKGKSEIRKLYEDLFKDAKQIQSKNTVEFARLIQPDVLVIHGSFKPDTDSEPLPFVQVRKKKGDKWLMFRLLIFVLDKE